MSSDPELLSVVQAFHAKMDTGFARLHERMDDQRDAMSSLKEETGRHTLTLDNALTQHLTNHPPAAVCPTSAVLAAHLRNHPEPHILCELVAERNELKDDKRAILKTVIVWSFRGLLLLVLTKVGLDKYWAP